MIYVYIIYPNHIKCRQKPILSALQPLSTFLCFSPKFSPFSYLLHFLHYTKFYFPLHYKTVIIHTRLRVIYLSHQKRSQFPDSLQVIAILQIIMKIFNFNVLPILFSDSYRFKGFTFLIVITKFLFFEIITFSF